MIAASIKAAQSVTTPIKKVTVSKLQLQLYQSLSENCPPGKVCTYLALAKSLGRPKAARMVSKLMSTNPFSPVVPCHRVVSSNLKLLGYFGTPAAEAILFRQHLLHEEGVKSIPMPSSHELTRPKSKSYQKQPKTLHPSLPSTWTAKGGDGVLFTNANYQPSIPLKYVVDDIDEFHGDLREFITFLETNGFHCVDPDPSSITTYDDEAMTRFVFTVPPNPLATHPENTLGLGAEKQDVSPRQDVNDEKIKDRGAESTDDHCNDDLSKKDVTPSRSTAWLK